MLRLICICILSFMHNIGNKLLATIPPFCIIYFEIKRFNLFFATGKKKTELLVNYLQFFHFYELLIERFYYCNSNWNSSAMENSKTLIYHEKQSLQLCLLHCLNNLFQVLSSFIAYLDSTYLLLVYASCV